MESSEILKISKFLSKVLRHKPQAINIKPDNRGWVSTDDLLNKLPENFKVDLEKLKIVVEKNNKQRFIFSEDFSKIRANQGHTIPIELEYSEIEPLEYLYHGTGEQNVENIFKIGILKGQRHHVHLSADIETAINVGKRHGKPFILKILAKKMYENKHKFYLTPNKVWLCEYIPINFIEKIQ